MSKNEIPWWEGYADVALACVIGVALAYGAIVWLS